MSCVQEQLLNRIFQLKETMDVTLIVPNDDREVRAHRLVLMGASEFFEKRFNGPWANEIPAGGIETVTMADVTYETLDTLVTFIYTNKLQFTPTSTVRMAILAADYLMMTDVLKTLSGYVASHIDSLNVCEIYPISNKLTPDVAVQLRDRVRTLLEDGHVPVDIGFLDYKEFYSLISSPRNEIEYLTNFHHRIHEKSDTHAVVRVQAMHIWLQTKPQDRQKYVLPLLAIIAFPIDTEVGFVF